MKHLIFLSFSPVTHDIVNPGKFNFSRNVLPPEFQNPPKGTTRLKLRSEAFLLEAIRRINEWEDLRQRIPDPKVIFQFVSPELKMQAITYKGSAELLYLLDGRRSLPGVIRISGQRRTDVYRLIAELEQEGASGSPPRASSRGRARADPTVRPESVEGRTENGYGSVFAST